MLEVGRIVRPHGLSGEVVVTLVTNREERLAPGSRLHVAGRELRVVRARGAGGRWLVAFEGVDGPAGAEELRGEKVLAAPLDDPEALWIHELIGAEVRSPAGVGLGTVRAVVANPASDLLELDGGALVPIRFVVEHHRGVVVVDVPPGLLD